MAEEIKEKENKIEQVTTGKVTVKKKTFWDEIKESFIVNDAHSIFSYVIKNVLVPSSKKIIADVIDDAVNVWLYPNGGGTSRRMTSSIPASRITYRDYSSVSRVRQEPVRQDEKKNQISKLIFEDRGDAEIVLGRLKEQAEAYGIATILDMYDAAGKSVDYTYDAYGWNVEEIKQGTIVRSRDGFVIDMPEARVIQK